MRTIDEEIKWHEELAEESESEAHYWGDANEIDLMDDALKFAEYHRQLAEWLRELKIHREIHDILLQLLVDFDLDLCCDDLMDDEKEELICSENCNNKSKGCWVRWAKLKAREVKADDCNNTN